MHGAGFMPSTGRGQRQPSSLHQPLAPMLGTSQGQQQPRAPEITIAQQGTGMGRQQASTPARTGALLGIRHGEQIASMLVHTGAMQRASVGHQQPSKPVRTRPTLATGSCQLQGKRPTQAGAIQAAGRATGAMLGTSRSFQATPGGGNRRRLQKKEGHPKKVQRPCSRQGAGQGRGQQARRGPAAVAASAPAAA